jgi:hypothetical protein
MQQQLTFFCHSNFFSFFATWVIFHRNRLKIWGGFIASGVNTSASSGIRLFCGHFFVEQKNQKWSKNERKSAIPLAHLQVPNFFTVFKVCSRFPESTPRQEIYFLDNFLFKIQDGFLSMSPSSSNKSRSPVGETPFCQHQRQRHHRQQSLEHRGTEVHARRSSDGSQEEFEFEVASSGPN